jgi:4-hydroxy-tetrahydrodipicolinate synthase
MNQIQTIIGNKPKDFEVLSGDDGLTFPMIALGAVGVISVAANCVPRTITKMVDLCLKEKFIDASALHYKLMPLFADLFIESNPIPIKYVMKRLGYGNGLPRLPLTELSELNKVHLDETIEKLGLI